MVLGWVDSWVSEPLLVTKHPLKGLCAYKSVAAFLEKCDRLTLGKGEEVFHHFVDHSLPSPKLLGFAHGSPKRTCVRTSPPALCFEKPLCDAPGTLEPVFPVSFRLLLVLTIGSYYYY